MNVPKVSAEWVFRDLPTVAKTVVQTLDCSLAQFL